MREALRQEKQMLSDEHYMALALAEARRAAGEGEVPIGAVIVQERRVVARARNRPIHSKDPTAHAEILALRRAARRLGNYRLNGCSLYVTIEPCAMCAGAMLQARLRRLVFGCRDAKAGAAGSVLSILDNLQLNHRVEVRGGVLGAECGRLLRSFFRARRRGSTAGEL